MCKNTYADNSLYDTQYKKSFRMPSGSNRSKQRADTLQQVTKNKEQLPSKLVTEPTTESLTDGVAIEKAA